MIDITTVIVLIIIGPGKEMFTGVLDNSEVGQRLISLLNVNAGLNATVF